MPDLMYWVKHDGKTYCWDNEAKTIVEVTLTVVPFEEVPREVLIAILNSKA